MAVSQRAEPACQGLLAGLRFRKKPDECGRDLSSHQFPVEFRWRVSGADRSRDEYRFGVRARLSSATDGRLLWPGCCRPESVGYFLTPTPKAANATSGAGFA